jgi:hypothetical protein
VGLALTVGYKKRGGFGADLLSLRTKVIGRRHFHKLKTSHDFLYPVIACPTCLHAFSFFNCDNPKLFKRVLGFLKQIYQN